MPDARADARSVSRGPTASTRPPQVVDSLRARARAAPESPARAACPRSRAAARPGRAPRADPAAPGAPRVARRAVRRRRTRFCSARPSARRSRDEHALSSLDRRRDRLGGRRRRRRAQVGDHVRDRVVGLVPDAGHDRNRARDDRARDLLGVERHQVLVRAAAAHEQARRRRRVLDAARRPSTIAARRPSPSTATPGDEQLGERVASPQRAQRRRGSPCRAAT